MIPEHLGQRLVASSQRQELMTQPLFCHAKLLIKWSMFEIEFFKSCSANKGTQNQELLPHFWWSRCCIELHHPDNGKTSVDKKFHQSTVHEMCMYSAGCHIKHADWPLSSCCPSYSTPSTKPSFLKYSSHVAETAWRISILTCTTVKGKYIKSLICN